MDANPLGTIYRRESMPVSYFVSSFTVKKTRASMIESIPDEMSVSEHKALLWRKTFRQRSLKDEIYRDYNVSGKFRHSPSYAIHSMMFFLCYVCCIVLFDTEHYTGQAVIAIMNKFINRIQVRRAKRKSKGGRIKVYRKKASSDHVLKGSDPVGGHAPQM
ncbi:hypothetical protein KQX54_007040 [Cotesia glomerata]|uniref:Uncharacterized protein n=1 Tax=Cotesia glomerata TaxID=32391 RepID=A0AAV7IVE7_COTGL|nr:hypothetical protein KQX54_007040 [Cotesia glomerata]